VGHLSGFQSLDIVNSDSVNMNVHLALSYPGVHSFIYVPKSGITGSYGSLGFFSLEPSSHFNLLPFGKISS
jgi:hypothetical protein